MSDRNQARQTADEGHAEFHRARTARRLFRLEGKVLIALTLVLCGALFLLYNAVFVLGSPPPPVPVDNRVTAPPRL